MNQRPSNKDDEQLEDRTSSQEKHQLAFLAKNATDMIYTMDMDQNITYMSPSVETILGYTVEETLQLHGKDLLTEASYQHQLKAFKKFLETTEDYAGPTETDELRLVRKDGSLIWGEVHARVMVDENNQPSGIFGICRDITKRKEAEKALQENEQKFRLLAEYSTDILYTQDLSDKQLITYVSPAIYDVLGYTVREVTGMPLKTILTEASYQQQVELLRKNMEQAEDLSQVSEILQVQLVRKDGKVIWGEAHARFTLDDEGNVTGIQGVMRDITERKEAEERERHYRENAEWLRNSAIELMELPAEKDIYRYIGENLDRMIGNALIIISEIQEDQSLVIPRHLYGLSQPFLEQLISILGLNPIGKKYELGPSLAQMYEEQKIKPFDGSLAEFARGSHSERLIKKIEQQLNLKKIYTVGLKRESRLLSAIHILKFREPEIKNIRFVETFLNQASIALQRRILENELRAAKEKAEESERLKTAFLGNMSHEIRTPLNIMLGYIQMFDTPNISYEERKNYIDLIQHSSEQLLDIINDILSMAKLETGQQQVQKQPFNINSLMSEVYIAFEQRARRKNLEFHCHQPLPQEQAWITSDETKVRQILHNLLNNAFKFTEKGSVEMGYRLSEGHMILYISDTGIGIPKDQQDRIFERFTQVEQTNQRKYEGTGLGLSISRGLAQLLEGEMSVNSRVNKGTTFYLKIPDQS